MIDHCFRLLLRDGEDRHEIFNFQGFPARSTVETWTLGRDFLSVYLDVQVSNFNSSQTEFLWPVPKIHLDESLEGGRENY